MSENKKQLQKMLATLDPDRLSKADFVSAFENVVKFMIKLENKNIKSVQKMSDEIEALKEDLKEANSKDINKSIDTLDKRINKSLKDQEVGMNLIKDKLREIKSGQDGLDGRDADMKEVVEKVLKEIPEQKEAILDTPQELVKKLSNLADDDRLDASAIKGLDELLDGLQSKIEGLRGTFGTGGGNVREVLKFNDISDSLNGVTKTFALPSFYKIISVQLSSFPNILRQDIDYTLDYETMKITFTSEIDAATSLAAGQTAIIIYAQT